MSIAICCIYTPEEEQRYLPSLRRAWQDFADELVLIEDVEHELWGDEQPWRERLFRSGVDTQCQWLFFLDADMIPAQNPRSIFDVAPQDCQGIAFRLYDLWQTSPLMYREDGFWQAHYLPRVWAVRNPGADFVPQWTERGIHCGHYPVNLPLNKCITALHKYSILHYGYCSEVDRKEKMERYFSIADQLSNFELMHAASIVDEDPNLLPLTFDIEYDIKSESASRIISAPGTPGTEGSSGIITVPRLAGWS